MCEGQRITWETTGLVASTLRHLTRPQPQHFRSKPILLQFMKPLYVEERVGAVIKCYNSVKDQLPGIWNAWKPLSERQLNMESSSTNIHYSSNMRDTSSKNSQIGS